MSSTAPEQRATLAGRQRHSEQLTVDAIDRVSGLFAASTQMQALAVETQARPIARAAELIVDSVLGGGKILGCGNARSAIDARYFALQMQHRFARERPGLPAIVLGSDAATLSAIGNDDGYDAVFAKQVDVLGRPGDVLLTLSVGSGAANVQAAIAAASERQIDVIRLTGGESDSTDQPFQADHVEIRAPSNEAVRVLENHRLVIHCLCELIDFRLLGG
jgi:phosphoheptose isomerase